MPIPKLLCLLRSELVRRDCFVKMVLEAVLAESVDERVIGGGGRCEEALLLVWPRFVFLQARAAFSEVESLFSDLPSELVHVLLPCGLGSILCGAGSGGRFPLRRGRGSRAIRFGFAGQWGRSAAS